MTTTIYLTLMMTSAQDVETSVITDNNPPQVYTYPEVHTTLSHVTYGFKPCAVFLILGEVLTLNAQVIVKPPIMAY